MIQTGNAIPLLRVKGTHFEMGQQRGKMFADEIKTSNNSMIRDAEENRGLNRETIFMKVRTYQPYMEKYAPNLVEEIRGLADGAGITYDEALLMQLRFEIVGYWGVKNIDGCTSFAISGEKTADGRALIGQNADINEYLEKTLRIIHFTPDEGPEILMTSYNPGMIGWLGINSEGMSCFGNAVVCSGWREGFPRYVLLRKILEMSTVKEALKFIESTHMASSINVVMADKTGDVKNAELALDKKKVTGPACGVVAHANHYVDTDLQQDDVLLPVRPGSSVRHGQMQNRLLTLVQKKEDVTMGGCKDILRDHMNFPHSICMHVDGVRPDRFKSIMSIVASPEEKYFEACKGNPCENEFYTYRL